MNAVLVQLLLVVVENMKGLGGAVNMTYSCDGCAIRTATFESSAVSSFRKLNIMKSLQVAFICAGCTYAQYQKVLENSFGIHVANNATFYRTLQEMYPIVKIYILGILCFQRSYKTSKLFTTQCNIWSGNRLKLKRYIN